MLFKLLKVDFARAEFLEQVIFCEISVCFKNERTITLQKPFLHGLSPEMISSMGPFISWRFYVSHANQPVTRATVQPSWAVLI